VYPHSESFAKLDDKNAIKPKEPDVPSLPKFGKHLIDLIDLLDFQTVCFYVN
jgi:hypothetical protein